MVGRKTKVVFLRLSILLFHMSDYFSSVCAFHILLSFPPLFSHTRREWKNVFVCRVFGRERRMMLRFIVTFPAFLSPLDIQDHVEISQRRNPQNRIRIQILRAKRERKGMLMLMFILFCFATRRLMFRMLALQVGCWC